MKIIPIGTEIFSDGIASTKYFCINFAFLILKAKIMFTIMLIMPILSKYDCQSIPCSENILTTMKNKNGGITVKIIVTATKEMRLITILINMLPSFANTFSFTEYKKLIIFSNILSEVVK